MLLLLNILFCFNNRSAVSTYRIDVIGRLCLNLLQELLLSGFYIYIATDVADRIGGLFESFLQSFDQRFPYLTTSYMVLLC